MTPVRRGVGTCPWQVRNIAARLAPLSRMHHAISCRGATHSAAHLLPCLPGLSCTWPNALVDTFEQAVNTSCGPLSSSTHKGAVVTLLSCTKVLPSSSAILDNLEVVAHVAKPPCHPSMPRIARSPQPLFLQRTLKYVQQSPTPMAADRARWVCGHQMPAVQGPSHRQDIMSMIKCCYGL